jgi:Protein of unknown function (DUF2846)
LQPHRAFWYKATEGRFGGVMIGRWVAAASAALLVSGCASQKIGTEYALVAQKVGQPKTGQSRIVVLSEKSSGLDAAGCDLQVDGAPVGRLTPGTYVYTDRPAGRHELVATQKLFPGDTKRDVSTESGRTYFFVARNSERARAVTGMAIMGGLAGALVASAATSNSENPGPIDFFPLDEAAARTALAELQLAE